MLYLHGVHFWPLPRDDLVRLVGESSWQEEIFVVNNPSLWSCLRITIFLSLSHTKQSCMDVCLSRSPCLSRSLFLFPSLSHLADTLTDPVVRHEWNPQAQSHEVLGRPTVRVRQNKEPTMNDLEREGRDLHSMMPTPAHPSPSSSHSPSLHHSDPVSSLLC